MKRLTAMLLCLLFLVSCVGCSQGNKKPFKAMKTRPVVVGFYANDIGGYDSLPSLKAHAGLLNEIHPLWYHVNPDGSFTSEINYEAVKTARDNGIKIIPLVNVVPSQDAVLLDEAAQDRAIANLVQEVKNNNYDGIDIDFEFFPASQIKDFTVDREQLTRFMQKLYPQMKSLGKVTYMAVLPHVGSSPEVGGVFDYGALTRYLDKVTIMTYDYDEAHGPPGPVAPFSWVESNIKDAVQQGFSPDKISLGVATYGYDWPQGEAGGFSKPTTEIMQQVARNGYQVKWSDAYQEPNYEYTDSYGNTRVVWFENEYTLQSKIDLVEKYKLAGISIWRLGYEDQRFWNRIQQQWGTR